MDALRAHELMTTLQENGICKLTAKDGSKLECHINSLTVVQALRLQEGNNPFSWMKVGAANKKALFGTEKANECVYGELKEPRIRLALQIHQQTFHMLKPQKYTHPDAHVAYIFSTATSSKTCHSKGTGELKSSRS